MISTKLTTELQGILSDLLNEPVSTEEARQAGSFLEEYFDCLISTLKQPILTNVYEHQ